MVVEFLAEQIKEKPQLNVMNLTRRFIAPCLSLYPEVSKDSYKLFTNLQLVSTCIWDDKYGEFKHDHLFLLFKRNDLFLQRLKEIRLLDWYRDDYPTGHIIDRNLHMIVVKLPIKNLTKHFLDGQYSKMYRPETAFSIFIKRYTNTNHPLKVWYARSYMVCTKQEDRRIQFEEEINNFTDQIRIRKGKEPFAPGTELRVHEDWEYEIKPESESEIFNYGQQPQFYNSFIQRINSFAI